MNVSRIGHASVPRNPVSLTHCPGYRGRDRHTRVRHLHIDFHLFGQRGVHFSGWVGGFDRQQQPLVVSSLSGRIPEGANLCRKVPSLSLSLSLFSLCPSLSVCPSVRLSD